ncbi:unnamed protein product [Moneuplotes crassus]|uniref:Uncharacterized protein n=1 Tax=Euplotes crassus TaxID=5936 RepID=A0AAD1XN26_EUPCR|nr:unnamed protein product [Moneuplotes crassus]
METILRDRALLVKEDDLNKYITSEWFDPNFFCFCDSVFLDKTVDCDLYFSNQDKEYSSFKKLAKIRQVMRKCGILITGAFYDLSKLRKVIEFYKNSYITYCSSFRIGLSCEKKFNFKAFCPFVCKLIPKCLNHFILTSFIIPKRELKRIFQCIEELEVLEFSMCVLSPEGVQLNQNKLFKLLVLEINHSEWNNNTSSSTCSDATTDQEFFFKEVGSSSLKNSLSTLTYLFPCPRALLKEYLEKYEFADITIEGIDPYTSEAYKISIPN